MAKTNKDSVRKASSEKSGVKQDRFEAKADAGDFKKVRAAPKAGVRGKAAEKGSAREKNLSEAQETFGPSVQKSESKSEQISKKVNQEFFDKHDQEDERNTEYASQREESRALRRHRQHDSRTRVKDSFIQSDGDFHDKTGFVEEAGAELSGSKKLEKLEQRLRKPERKQKKQGRDFHSRRNISWCVILMKQQGRSLMSLKPGKSRSVQRRKILPQLQPEEQ